MSEFTESLHIWLPGSGLMLALILCSAFFSASETAFFFLSRDQIRRFSSGNVRQKMVSQLMVDPDRLLTAVLFWNLLINLAYFSVGIVVIQKLSQKDFHMVAATVGVLNFGGMIVFGEVFPKSSAVVFRRQLAPLASLPLAAAVAILDPFIPLLDHIARVLRRSFWPHVQHEPHLQPEDLEQALDASAAFSTDLLEIEQEILHNVLDMSEVDVEEVMRPRQLTVVVDPDDTLVSLSERGIEATEYVLLREEDPEEYRRAVALSAIQSDRDIRFRDYAEPVIYVPWCASVAFVLSELRNRYRSVAIVVHEHGEMVGMVTYEELLESILTDSPSRTRRVLRREPLIEIGDNRYHAEGLVTLRYLCSQLRIAFVAEDDNLTTLAGLFHEELSRIPQVGDRIVREGWIFTAIEVNERSLVRALVEPAGYFSEESEESQ